MQDFGDGVSPIRCAITGFCPEQTQGPGRGVRQPGGQLRPPRLHPPVECRLQRTPNQELGKSMRGLRMYQNLYGACLEVSGRL